MSWHGPKRSSDAKRGSYNRNDLNSTLSEEFQTIQLNDEEEIENVTSKRKKSKKREKKKKSRHYAMEEYDPIFRNDSCNWISINPQQLWSLKTPEEKDLLEFVAEGNISKVSALVDPNTKELINGGDINKQNNRGITALHVAVLGGDSEMVKFLLENTNIKTQDTIFLAIREGNLEIFELIYRREFKSNCFFGEADSRTNEDTRRNIKTWKYIIKQTWNSEFSTDTDPLQLAAQNGHYDIIEFLHQRGMRLKPIFIPEKICTKYNKDGYKCIKYNKKSSRLIENSIRQYEYYQARSHPQYICYLTNAVLIPNGKSGKMSNEYQDDLEEFKNKNKLERNDSIGDPVEYVFNLIELLREIKSNESDYKIEYKKLISQLETFATQLLNLCRSCCEVELFFSPREGIYEKNEFSSRHPRLLRALDMDLKQFVAHNYAEKYMRKEWVGNTESKSINLPLILPRIILGIPFLLVLFVLQWFDAKQVTKVVRDQGKPRNRCINSFASYLVFLAVLMVEIHWEWQFYTDFQCIRTYKGTDWVVFVFVMGHLLNMIKVFLYSPKTYFDQFWNIYDSLNMFFYLITFISWFFLWIGYGRSNTYDFDIKTKDLDPTCEFKRENWTEFHPELYAESFFTVAIILSMARVLRYLTIDPNFGPFLIAMLRMIGDIKKFVIFYVVILISFSIGFTNLFYYYKQVKDDNPKFPSYGGLMTSFETLRMSLTTCFWAIFTMSSWYSTELKAFADYIPTDDELKILNKTHVITKTTGEVLFGIYHILASFIMLNLVIAVVSNSFARIADNVVSEWKFHRSKIYQYYMRSTYMPSPFNLLFSARSIRCLFLAMFKKSKTKKLEKEQAERGSNLSRGEFEEMNKESDSDYSGSEYGDCDIFNCCFTYKSNNKIESKKGRSYLILMKRIVERYLRNQENFNFDSRDREINEITKNLHELRPYVKNTSASIHYLIDATSRLSTKNDDGPGNSTMSRGFPTQEKRRQTFDGRISPLTTDEGSGIEDVKPGSRPEPPKVPDLNDSDVPSQSNNARANTSSGPSQRKVPSGSLPNAHQPKGPTIRRSSAQNDQRSVPFQQSYQNPVQNPGSSQRNNQNDFLDDVNPDQIRKNSHYYE